MTYLSSSRSRYKISLKLSFFFSQAKKFIQFTSYGFFKSGLHIFRLGMFKFPFIKIIVNGQFHLIPAHSCIQAYTSTMLFLHTIQVHTRRCWKIYLQVYPLPTCIGIFLSITLYIAPRNSSAAFLLFLWEWHLQRSSCSCISLLHT